MAIRNSYTTKESLERDKMLLPLILERFDVYKDGRIINKKTGQEVGRPKNEYSYGGIGIRIDGKVVYINTHRVIWLVHKGFVPIGYTINHKNGVKGQPRLTNLELLTSGENQKHAIELGLKSIPKIHRGACNYNASFSKKQVILIRRYFRLGLFSKETLAKKFCVHKATINNCLKGDSYSDIKGAITDINEADRRKRFKNTIKLVKEMTTVEEISKRLKLPLSIANVLFDKYR